MRPPRQQNSIAIPKVTSLAWLKIFWSSQMHDGMYVKIDFWAFAVHPWNHFPCNYDKWWEMFWPREAGSMFSVNKQGFCVESLWHRKHAALYSGHNHFHGLVRRWKPKHHAGWHKIIPLQARCHPLNTQKTARILQQGIQAEAMLMCQAPHFVLINSS